MPAKPPGARALALRFLYLFLIIFSTVLVMYFEGGLVDQRTGESPGFISSLYFTMVTITTVGYGDIVPESNVARLLDAFFLTPMRFIFIFVFVGIAYELSIKQLREDIRMNQLVRKLKDHIILCGYGETGRVALQELIAQGAPADQIVVIDTDPSALDGAAKLGVVTIEADASRESVLKGVAIERAAHVLVCPGRDDTAVLTSLTARDMNPNAKISVMCHEVENVRLVARSGADTIISPAGGNMLAASTRRPHLVDTLRDILEIRGSVKLDERIALAEEVGKDPRDLKEIAVIRLYRKGKPFSLNNFPMIDEGDILVYVSAIDQANSDPESKTPWDRRRSND